MKHLSARSDHHCPVVTTSHKFRKYTPHTHCSSGGFGKGLVGSCKEWQENVAGKENIWLVIKMNMHGQYDAHVMKTLSKKEIVLLYLHNDICSYKPFCCLLNTRSSFSTPLNETENRRKRITAAKYKCSDYLICKDCMRSSEVSTLPTWVPSLQQVEGRKQPKFLPLLQERQIWLM